MDGFSVNMNRMQIIYLLVYSNGQKEYSLSGLKSTAQTVSETHEKHCLEDYDVSQDSGQFK